MTVRQRAPDLERLIGTTDHRATRENRKQLIGSVVGTAARHGVDAYTAINNAVTGASMPIDVVPG